MEEEPLNKVKRSVVDTELGFLQTEDGIASQLFFQLSERELELGIKLPKDETEKFKTILLYMVPEACAFAKEYCGLKLSVQQFMLLSAIISQLPLESEGGKAVIQIPDLLGNTYLLAAPNGSFIKKYEPTENELYTILYVYFKGLELIRQFYGSYARMVEFKNN